MGFKPQLSKEQIQKIYHDLAADFAEYPFLQAMEKSRTLAKKYYACYPFLLQIAILWLNHFMLAPDSNLQQEILKEAAELCSHIISDCSDIGLCNDAVILKATIDLQNGKAPEVIDTLEKIWTPTRLAGQSDGILIQAYLLAGENEKAAGYTQISMYTHLISLAGGSIQYLSILSGDLPACEEIIRRTTAMIELFRLDHLHPNTAASFYFQAAVTYCLHGREASALTCLRNYEETIRYLLAEDHLSLHGDEYFSRLDEWFGEFDLGPAPPRDRKVIAESALQLLAHPSFSVLQENAEFKQIKDHLEKEVQNQ